MLLYPVAVPTVAINLFLLGLIFHSIGLPEISPARALWLSVPLGGPATWLAGRWLRRLLDEAA